MGRRAQHHSRWVGVPQNYTANFFAKVFSARIVQGLIF